MKNVTKTEIDESTKLTRLARTIPRMFFGLVETYNPVRRPKTARPKTAARPNGRSGRPAGQPVRLVEQAQGPLQHVTFQEWASFGD
jgi:hypothetical protein